MGERIAVEVSQLNKDLQDINQNIELIVKELKELEGDMNLLNSMWSGPSNQVQRYQTSKNIQEAGRICEKLRLYTEGLAYAAREYKKCEEKVLDAVAYIWI